MSISSLLKKLSKALPAVLAAAPGVVDAVKQVKQAVRKPKPKAGDEADSALAGGAPAAAGRLVADSEQGAR